MAGERKGKTYEVLLKVVLDDLVAHGALKGQLFWNDKPAAMLIEPDFTVGTNKDHPKIVFLVSHGGSVKESNRKYWRNVGELWEAKVLLPKPARVISITFDSLIKDDIKGLEAETFDASLIVGDSPYGPGLIAWVENETADLPKAADDKVDAICAILRQHGRAAGPRRFVANLTKDVEATVATAQSRFPDLWVLARKHQSMAAPTARDTFVRRGMMKAALIGRTPPRSQALSPSEEAITDALKMSRKKDMARTSLVGARLVDSDLVWLTHSQLKSIDVATLVENYGTDGFRRQLKKVRSVAVLPHLLKFVADNLQSLQTKRGMLVALQSLHANPAAGVRLPSGVPAPETLWMFDIVGAIVRAGSGRAQDFGYSSFAKHPDANLSKLGNMTIGAWCSCFMNQYFNRQHGFHAPAAAVKYCASVLADALSLFSAESIGNTNDEIREQYINKELEVGLLTHRGFDPIGALLLNQLKEAGLSATEITIQAAFAERAIALGVPLGTGSSTTSLIKVKSTGISWQSAHGSHTNDKRKELCGRALATKYRWNDENKRFEVRPALTRLLLVLDGTWTQGDINSLLAAGWDGIFYPDEMERLIKAIV